MYNLRYIENILIQKNINQYKIMKTKEKSLFYRDSFGKIFYDDILIEKILVLFKAEKGIAKFSISDCNSTEEIDYLINKCIENTPMMDICWYDDKVEVNKNISPKLYESFNNFNVHSYMDWIKDEVSKVIYLTNFKLNTVYILNIYKDISLSNKGFCEKYRINSECICMENETFEKKAFINSIFPHDSLSAAIIKEFNQKI